MLKLKVGLDDTSKIVGPLDCVIDPNGELDDVLSSVGNIVILLEIKVGRDVFKLVGKLDYDDDTEELSDVVSIVGKSDTFPKLKVGFGVNFILVGTDVLNNVGGGVKVISVELIVGSTVIIKFDVGLDISKLVGALDLEDDILELENVGTSVKLFKLEVGLGDSLELIVGTNVLNNNDGIEVNPVEPIVGNIVVLSKIEVGLDVSKLVGEVDCVGGCVEILDVY